MSSSPLEGSQPGTAARLVDETTGPADPVRYDTAGTVTEAPFTPGTDTALVVRTLDGPTWTTDPDHTPFDVRVFGARLRVTAVSEPVDGVQTMTVEPAAVNEVTRPIPDGSPVSLWTPAVYAL